MYAERQSLTRPPCAPDGPLIADFEAGFPFSPTADQLSCFADVQRDMVSSERPMDRLVCGDVGFGKTEVAMRAAYRAVSNGRRAAAPLADPAAHRVHGYIMSTMITPCLAPSP